MLKNITFFVLGALLAAGLLWNKTQKEHHHDHEHEHHDHDHELVEMDGEKAALHNIEIKTAGPGVVKTAFNTRGKVVLHPDRKALLSPKVSGIVKEARKNRGDSVAQGEVVAVIESREIAEAKAQYLAALEKEKLAASLFDREARLFEKRISSEEEFLNAQSALEEAKINFRLAKQQLFALGLLDEEIASLENQSGRDMRLYEVRSPLRGTVVERTITFGEHLDEKTSIYEIADLSKVLVEMAIYPKDLDQVQEGLSVEVEGRDHAAIGKIIYVSPLIEEDTIAAKAFAEINNKDRHWKPGTFVKVNVNTDVATRPVVVAKDAVHYIEGEPVIFVQTAEGFLKRSVVLGASDDHNTEITEGVDAGTKYAATNAFLLKADLGKDSCEHEH